jgi:hypothetical protein
MTLDEQFKQWDPIMEGLLGKEKWQSLTYWQQMCEIAAIQEYYKHISFGSLFGFSSFYR